MPATILPEQGQLVTVRQRRYVVSEVAASALPADPLRSSAERQHLVTLQSVEDEGLGEELQVIWELEPGARAYEHVPLPEPAGFDDPATLEAFLNAIRWGAVSSADTRALQAPFRAGIDLEDYQLDPVVRAIQMPRVNLLVADDVGLGKTIEAGLVMQELLLRHRARTILVVCPSSLQIQWHDQMRDKFGLEFRIVDGALFKELRRKRGLHANPWTHFPRLITSIDFLKRERPLRLFREALPRDVYPRRFDILVVDEAHCIAPSGTGAYATDSLRTQAVRTIAPHFEHRLFLTATPHNGYANSFSALLEILDNQRFARGVSPTRAQLGAVMVRRLKAELPPLWDGTPRFPTRDLDHPILVPYPEEERTCHQWLRHYTDLRLAHCRDHAEESATRFVLKTLKKRLFSSPAAFLATLEKHQQSLLQARRATVKPPPVKVLERRFDDLEDDYDDDEQLEQASEEVVEGSSLLFRSLTAEEESLLKRMSEYARRAVGRPDAKARELIAWLRRTRTAWSSATGASIATDRRGTWMRAFTHYAASPRPAPRALTPTWSFSGTRPAKWRPFARTSGRSVPCSRSKWRRRCWGGAPGSTRPPPRAVAGTACSIPIAGRSGPSPSTSGSPTGATTWFWRISTTASWRSASPCCAH